MNWRSTVFLALFGVALDFRAVSDGVASLLDLDISPSPVIGQSLDIPQRDS